MNHVDMDQNIPFQYESVAVLNPVGVEFVVEIFRSAKKKKLSQIGMNTISISKKCIRPPPSPLIEMYKIYF